MSSGSTRGGNPNKGGSKTSKQSKSDLKSDNNKQLDLNAKIQPTAEQMQIAKIMDSHRSEDPELQKKIRQVMEITRASEDEACMALHSREYDTAQAITLLTDGSGQLLSSEWAQAGKKKKTKTPGTKADGPAGDKQRGTGKEGRGERSDKRDTRGDRAERDSKDTEADDGQTPIGNDQSRREDRGGGRGGDRGGDRDGRGRGSRRGGRGRGTGRADNKENDEVSGSRPGFVGGFGGRMANGPGRGRGAGGIGRGRGGTGGLARDGRTFASRTRGRDDDSSYHPIDVWENSQADTPTEKPPLKVDKWDEFPSAEDWDNEEYTGSLQETKVFTPSTQTQVAPPLGDTTNGVGPNHLGSSVSPGLVGDVKISSVGSGDGEPSVGSAGVVPGQSIDLSLLLQKPPNSSNVTNVSNAGANLLATLQSSYSNSNQVQMSNANQPLPPRHKVQRPRGPTTKIPSSAVEMPVDSVTTLDVQFGGLEFDDNSSMSFNSVMHGGSTKSNAEILYGSPPTNSYTAADKESLGSKQSEPQAPSPFQNQRNSQSSIVETVSSVPISPNIDSHSLTLQNQVKNSNPPQSSYVNSANVVSAFVSYGKGAPGFPAAPGFAPVAQPVPPGTVSYSNNSNSTGGAVTATSYSTSTNSQTGYHNNMGSLSYGNQPVVSAVLQPSQIQTQPIIASASQNSYSGTVSQTPTYHHSANAVYGNNSNQYGTYGQKLQSALSAQNVVSGHQQTVKDSSSDSNSSVPASGSSSANSVQMGSLQQGQVIVSTSSSNPKISSSSNVPTSAAGAKMGIPPGMVMQPQYIMSQNGVPAFYSIQPSFYGFDENMQILPARIPAQLQGYYDPNAAANYGNPMSFALEATTNAGVQGGPGSTRNDGTTLPSFSGSDSRFPRSDSSTASPVPSNIAGQSTQQPMYNPGLPGGYYFVGNNMMHAGTHFPYAPPHMYPTTAMATPTNASGAPHAASANHQYQNKGVYNPSYSYEGPQGPSTDFSKNSYAGGPGVGPNSNSGKSVSSTPSGTSQTTDLNTSMYGKGHLNKINSYEKPYVSGGGYNALGGTNPLNSQLSGAGPYNVYIAPVQPLPLPQDGSNVSRQGTGQPKGNKQQQYGTGPPQYWPN